MTWDFETGSGRLQEANVVHTSMIDPDVSPVANVLNPLGAMSPLRLLCAFAMLAATSFSHRLSAQIPAAVATTQSTLAAGVSAGRAVVDACGDVYVNQNGGTNSIIEIQAGTGSIITVATDTQGYNGGQALYMDLAKKYLYYPDTTAYYTQHFVQLPIVNCLPGTPNLTFAGDFGGLVGYYYGTASDITGDAAGDVFFTTTAGNNKNIYQSAYTAGTPGTYTESLRFTHANNVNSIASDASGNLYFVDNKTADVYLLSKGATAATIFVPAASFKSIAGLTFDPQGNLYLADTGKSLVFEVPVEAGALNPAHLYAVASSALVANVAVDGLHNIFLSNYYPGATELRANSVLVANTSVGKIGTASINYVFNTSVTPTSITTVTGTGASSTFTPGTGCAVGTAYAALSTCSLNVNFTPTAVGLQTGAVSFISAAGTLQTALAGDGMGGAITVDPGLVTPLTSTLTAPSGVTVDNLGNLYVTDTVANTLTKFPGGASGAPTPVATGTITLSAPQAVAVDNVGDIFIADTGNSRIVEIPVVNGVLTNAASFVLALKLNKPQGVAVDGAGDLLVADTGDNAFVFVPNLGGSLNVASSGSYGVGLKSPSALTVDANGNVFVAETGNNDVLEFAAPLGSAAQIVVASSLSSPSGLATDASGSLFVADSGSGNVFRYPNFGGNFGTGTLAGSTVSTPTGVATDAGGNLYVSDNAHGAVDYIARVQATADFKTYNVGATSNPITVAVYNSGNAPLTFASPSFTASGQTNAGFTVTNDGCAGKSDLPGGSCPFSATFTPPVAEVAAKEVLTFNSDAAAGKASLTLLGTGAKITATATALALTSPSAGTQINAGAPVTFNATINVGAGTLPATGKITFTVNGITAGIVTVANNAATITIKNGLPGGNPDVIAAYYSGDGVNYSGSDATLNETVVALPDSVSLIAITPYTNPQSANDSASNSKGPAVPLVATIVPSGTIAAGGFVTFYAGTNIIGIASVLPGPGGVYVAKLTTTGLRAGTSNAGENGSYLTAYSLSAVYSGDNIYGPSTSGSVPVTIVGANTIANKANTTGATFTISPSMPSIVVNSTTAGTQASGSTVLTITSYGGWAGVLNFTCSGLPAYSNCAPFPGAPLVSLSTAAAPLAPTTVSFIINTNVAPVVPTAASILWWFSALGGFTLFALRRRVRGFGYGRSGHLLTILGIGTLTAVSICGVTGCSSGKSSFITPAGTSNVTVTVNAVQNLVGSTTGQVLATPDVNVPPFTIALTVK